MFRKVMVINGDTLVIPELNNFKGKKVEVTFKEFNGDDKPEKNLKKYFGILKAKGDGMEIQKKMREEWETGNR